MGKTLLAGFLIQGMDMNKDNKDQRQQNTSYFLKDLCPHDGAGNMKEELKMRHGLWRKRCPSRISLFKTESMLERWLNN